MSLVLYTYIAKAINNGILLFGSTNYKMSYNVGMYTNETMALACRSNLCPMNAWTMMVMALGTLDAMLM